MQNADGRVEITSIARLWGINIRKAVDTPYVSAVSRSTIHRSSILHQGGCQQCAGLLSTVQVSYTRVDVSSLSVYYPPFKYPTPGWMSAVCRSTVHRSSILHQGGCQQFVGLLSTVRVSYTRVDVSRVPVYCPPFKYPTPGWMSAVCRSTVHRSSILHQGGCQQFVGLLSTVQVSYTRVDVSSVPVYCPPFKYPTPRWMSAVCRSTVHRSSILHQGGCQQGAGLLSTVQVSYTRVDVSSVPVYCPPFKYPTPGWMSAVCRSTIHRSSILHQGGCQQCAGLLSTVRVSYTRVDVSSLPVYYPPFKYPTPGWMSAVCRSTIHQGGYRLAERGIISLLNIHVLHIYHSLSTNILDSNHETYK